MYSAILVEGDLYMNCLRSLFKAFFLIPGLLLAGDFSLWRYGQPEAIIAPGVVERARATYAPLRAHQLFNRRMRIHRALFTSACSALQAPEQVLSTPDGHAVHYFHIKRGSPTLVICASGFPEECQTMAYLAAVFEPYDVLFFDFRWAHEQNFFSSWPMILHPYRAAIFDCVADVNAVLAYAHAGGYKQVVGAGVCYSSGMFILAQEQARKNGERGFDKLILESCWLSMQAFADNFLRDPYLVTQWGRGGAPAWLRAITSSFPLYHIMRLLAYLILPHFGLDEHLKQVGDTPILFVHGRNDVLVSLDKFQQLWQAAGPASVALITPFQHSNNSSKAREVYTHVSRAFIEKPLGDFYVDCGV